MTLIDSSLSIRALPFFQVELAHFRGTEAQTT